jgi:putative CocE/NonD family hydrolase
VTPVPARRVRDEFPHAVRVIEHTWIPLSDGVRLSARVWLPVDAEDAPVPAILEYLPYRKGDSSAIDDSLRHPWFAGHGYAAVRVDIRGSGDSEGVLLDEYHPQEQLDCLEVLRWIAAQPWCSGSVGMMGISWGGFNSLQVAAHRPPELKAIITCCSTDDRYADDVHYMGGLPLAFYMLPWASVMLAYNARPPDPAVVGERWRDLWLERLEGSPYLAETWLRHQRRDGYWAQGSVCEDYGAIEAAVYAVGGWSDGYTNAVLRLLEGLSCPRKGLIGPWEHVWPEEGYPGPAIGFLQEALRFWDHWLKDEPNDVMNGPLLRFWRQTSAPPRSAYEIRPGGWASEPAWPSPRVATRTLYLAPGALADAPGGGERLAHASPLTLGADAGSWLPYGNPADLPADQRDEDAWSLCFESETLVDELDLLGRPEARLRLAADRASAFVAVRLCDVRPDGSSALITRGVLNLCHRDGHDSPSALEPGREYDVVVPLKAISYVLPPGHRLRLGLSTSYWPWIWPSPDPVTLTLACDEASVLALPVREVAAEPADDPGFGAPETSRPLPFTLLAERNPRWEIARDAVSGRHTVVMSRALWGSRRLPDGLEYRDRDPVRFAIVEGDPLSARVECERTIEIGRGDWRTRIEVRAQMSADAESFHVTGTLDVFEGETPVIARAHSLRIPRDHC